MTTTGLYEKISEYFDVEFLHERDYWRCEGWCTLFLGKTLGEEHKWVLERKKVHELQHRLWFFSFFWEKDAMFFIQTDTDKNYIKCPCGGVWKRRNVRLNGRGEISLFGTTQITYHKPSHQEFPGCTHWGYSKK